MIDGHSSHHVKGIEVYRASPDDVTWLANTLNREGRRFRTHIRIGPDEVLKLVRA